MGGGTARLLGYFSPENSIKRVDSNAIQQGDDMETDCMSWLIGLSLGEPDD